MSIFKNYTLLCLHLLARTISATAPEPIAGFTVIWAEDFSGPALNTTNWTRWTGISSNNEQETYTTSPTTCALTGTDSFLITPQRTNGQWTSCRIETNPSFAATPGSQLIVQARMKLGTPGAALQGIWPAFWSLGQAMREGSPGPPAARSTPWRT
ncbi:hypothetical protein LARI1_G006392, partial [Lachnellula arida]